MILGFLVGQGRLASAQPAALRSFRLLTTKATAAATQSAADEIRCIECGAPGHKAKECPEASGKVKKNTQDYFKEGRCFVCGEVGHAASFCPSLGKKPEDGKPPVPKPEKEPLEVRHAQKTCYQCGQKGHIMKNCPISPSNMKIKGIRERFSGSRLQKMLPLALKNPRDLPPAHDALSKAPPKIGVVVKTSAQKTIGVLVPRTVRHPLLNIELNRSQRFLVHDEEEAASCGDIVLIQQSRPISKNKHFALKSILSTLNDRKETRVARVRDVKEATLAGLDQAVIEKLKQLRDNDAARLVDLKRHTSETLAAARSKIVSEMNTRTKNIPSILDQAEEEATTKNDAWLRQMQRKLDSVDELLRGLQKEK